MPDVAIADGTTARLLSGADGSELASFTNNTLAGVVSNVRVADVGDFDGDGVADWVVGAPMVFNVHGATIGYFVVVSGANGGELFSQYGSYTSPSDYESGLGYAFAPLGDLDGDGFADFVTGSQFRIKGFGVTSHVEVVHGAAATAQVRIDVYDPGSVGPDLVCQPFVNAGDVDGDGVADFTDVWVKSGIARIELRSGHDGHVFWTVKDDTASTLYGSQVTSAGDVDGDGIGDLFVGAPMASNGASLGGRVDVLSGKDGHRLARHVGTTASEELGFGLAPIGDFTGDGIGDVVAGAPGLKALFVLDGARGEIVARFDVAGAGGNFAVDLATPGDLDGDGRPDLVAGNDATTALRLDPTLTLTSIEPARVDHLAPGRVTLHGSGFRPNDGVAFDVDGVAATNVTVDSFLTASGDLAVLAAGPHDVTVNTATLGSATLAGGLIATPAVLVSGDLKPGGFADVSWLFEPFDTVFAIYGLPPVQSIPTPPFDGTLGILPFTVLFLQAPSPADEIAQHFDIPNDPALSGVTVSLQELAGPQLTGHGKSGSWSNTASLAIQ